MPYRSRRGRPLKVLDATTSPAASLADELRRRRRGAGLTQADLAELVGCGRTTVAQVELGDGEPSFSLLAACDVVLGAGGALVSLYPAVVVGAAIRRDHQAQARRAAEGLAVWPVVPAGRGKLEGTVTSTTAPGSPATNRRHALRYTLGAPLVAAGVDWSALLGFDSLPAPSERLAKAIERPHRLDAAVLDELEATNVRNERLDSQLGTRAMLGPVLAHLSLVTSSLVARCHWHCAPGWSRSPRKQGREQRSCAVINDSWERLSPTTGEPPRWPTKEATTLSRPAS